MKMELRKPLASAGAHQDTRRGEGFQSLYELLRQPVLAVQYLFEASDLATEVTPQAKRQKTALVKMKLKELSEDLQQRKESSLF